MFEGNPDHLVDRESDRWDGVDGLDSWSLRRYELEGYDSLLKQQQDGKGAIGGDWEYRLKPLLAEFALASRREVA